MAIIVKDFVNGNALNYLVNNRGGIKVIQNNVCSYLNP